MKRDGSLLFDGEALWTAELLTRLYDAFIGTPDEGDRKFLEKFRDQLENVGDPAVTKLAAEVLYVYFLFPESVSGRRKREVVNTVLGWADSALDPQDPLFDVFDGGLGSAGQGYNSRRPFEMAYLIDFVRAWKALPVGDRQRALDDPWEMMNEADAVERADSMQMRHMLLHLLFPETFEHVASSTQKRKLVGVFSDLVPEEDRADDLDRQLLAIRDSLAELLPNHDVSYYEEPLRSVWDDGAGNDSDVGAPLDLIRYKKQVVLHGPPGTGKTYRAKRLAAQLIRGAYLRENGAADLFRSAEPLQELIESHVHVLQLHPAYGYDDFVVGLHISDGDTKYQLGYLPKLARRIEQDGASPGSRIPHVIVLDEMNRTDLTRMLGEYFSLLENRGEVVCLTATDADGEPVRLSLPSDLFVIGTMNLIDQSVDQIDFALRRRFLWIACPFDRDALVSAAEHRWRSNGRQSIPWATVQDDFDTLADAAVQLNEHISNSDLLGPQYEIGHAYFLDAVAFLQAEPNLKRKSVYLWSQKGEATQVVRQLWSLAIEPLLSEYLAGLDQKAARKELERLQAVLLKPAA